MILQNIARLSGAVKEEEDNEDISRIYFSAKFRSEPLKNATSTELTETLK